MESGQCEHHKKFILTLVRKNIYLTEVLSLNVFSNKYEVGLGVHSGEKWGREGLSSRSSGRFWHILATFSSGGWHYSHSASLLV